MGLFFNRSRSGYDSHAPLGFRVERATENLPQSADGALFTITGGQVVITMIRGEVTTVIQTQADNLKLKFNPTATGADQDLCAVLDITADPVGEIYTISGVVADALRSDLLIGAMGLIAAPLLLSEGDIELDASASNTGQVQWTVWWYPLEDGASLVSA